MSTRALFGDSEPDRKPVPATREGRARVQRAERNQVEFRPSCLENLLPDEHRARSIWEALEALDLSGFYVDIDAREGSAGRPAIDPRILIALWLYATMDGVGSARELARLCEVHDVYRWLCGGVSVNHHTLSDFRVGHEKHLDELMTQILGALMHEGLIGMRRIAQDGMKVRASAGAASFRRHPSLKDCLRDAREQVRNVKRQLQKEGNGAVARLQAARLRAAKERVARVNKAMAELHKVRESKTDGEEKKNARASTTDPEARVMKMADGGWRPAYNIQFATDVESRAIVGVTVTNKGNDQGQIEPMLEEIGRRTEKLPEDLLVDGGYVKLASIEAAESAGVKVYAPLQEARRADVDPSKPKPGDGPGVKAWRRRMTRELAARIYKDRAATAETTNADLKQWRGLDRLNVRGASKVLSVALWAAMALNLLRCFERGVLT
jgi:transposase